jgi:two-component system cell cycle response regulator
MADLDHFKRINDTFGHPAGDAVLRQVAGRMGASIRAFDSVGRYGGEEFLIVLPDCGALEAQEVAERVRRGIGDEPLRTHECNPIPVTLSIGVAIAPRESYSAEHFVRVADAALYRATQLGRNRIELDQEGKNELACSSSNGGARSPSAR